MGFEKRVLDVVAEVLKSDNSAAFTCGTLFVECTAKEAAKVETALLEATACGVVVSGVGTEFAFDFV